MKNDLPKVYHPTEEKINIWTHIAGALIAFSGVAGVLVLRPPQNIMQTVGILVYAVTLIFMYVSSAWYHSRPNPSPARQLGRKMDHCAIFLLIGGTYTGVLLIFRNGALAGMILPVIWGCAVVGLILNGFFFGRFQWVSILLYLVMGWFIVLFIRDLIANMAPVSLFLLVLGGVFYTVGVIFYLLRVKFSHAFWHFFVLGGSISHFFSVASIIPGA